MSRWNLSHSVLGIIVLAAFVVAGFAAITGVVPFPSTQSEAASPDGRFAVVNVDSNAEPHHTLFFEDRLSKTRRKLLEYGRQVEVLWNPSSTAFAVTDYAGSNIAECLVFTVGDIGSSQNVADKVQSTISDPRELDSLHDSSHIYWVAVRWASPQTLVVKVWGHTDTAPSRGFKYFHTFRAMNTQ